MAPLADQFAVDAHCEPSHLVGVVCPVIELGVEDFVVFHVTGQRLLAYAPERRRLVDLLREGALIVGAVSFFIIVSLLRNRRTIRQFLLVRIISRLERKVGRRIAAQQGIVYDRRHDVVPVDGGSDIRRLRRQSQSVVIGDVGNRRSGFGDRRSGLDPVRSGILCPDPSCGAEEEGK